MAHTLNDKDGIKLRDALSVLEGIQNSSIVLGCANISDVTEFDGCIDKILYGFGTSMDVCLKDIKDILTRNSIIDIS